MHTVLFLMSIQPCLVPRMDNGWQWGILVHWTKPTLAARRKEITVLIATYRTYFIARLNDKSHTTAEKSCASTKRVILWIKHQSRTTLLHVSSSTHIAFGDVKRTHPQQNLVANDDHGERPHNILYRGLQWAAPFA